MTVICYPAGGFGSTVEFGIKHFSKEHGPLDIDPFHTSGSMHNYDKENHIILPEEIPASIYRKDKILSICYPMQMLQVDKESADQVSIEHTMKNIKPYFKDDKTIFIYCKTIRSIEILNLMRFTKIPFERCLSSISIDCAREWNPAVEKVSDLETWQLRELLSMQFNDNIDSYLTINQYVEKHWFTVELEEILQELPRIINNVISYVGWSKNNEDISPFFTKWQEKQYKIVNRLEIIDNIVKETITDNGWLTWGELNLIDQALIQARLLREGYEIMCDGLNLFPTDSNQLKKLLLLR